MCRVRKMCPGEDAHKYSEYISKNTSEGLEEKKSQLWNSGIFLWTSIYLVLNFISLIYFFILHHISNTGGHSSTRKTGITVFPVKYGIYSISHFGTVILMYPQQVQHFISVTHIHAQTHNILSLFFFPASINLSFSSLFLSLFISSSTDLCFTPVEDSY